jgi:hypothetical protein
VRESLDDVLRRRPSIEADAKGSASGGRLQVLTGAGGTGDGSDGEDAEIDFKVSDNCFGGWSVR